MHLNQKGFSLIELMIVVAIIGIMASLAIPAYQNYIARAQVTEAVTIITGLKIDFTTFFGSTGVCPTNSSDGFSTPTGYQGRFIEKVDFGGSLPSVTGSTCSLIATFKTSDVVAGLSGKKVIVAMTIASNGTSNWEMRQSVTNGDVPPVMLPNTLR